MHYYAPFHINNLKFNMDVENINLHPDFRSFFLNKSAFSMHSISITLMVSNNVSTVL